jgi:hypothetical protein
MSSIQRASEKGENGSLANASSLVVDSESIDLWKGSLYKIALEAT